jgi:pimeloyl-ACP methyl ester carboxylesterase
LFDLLRDDPKTKPLADGLDERVLAVVNDLAAGNMEEGARRFVDSVAIGPGSWDNFVPDEAKRTLINNAPTFLDETRDPEALTIDTQALSRFSRPVLLSGGSESLPIFAPVLDKLAAILPNATRKTFAGTGHIPHLTHPQEYIEAIVRFASTE